MKTIRLIKAQRQEPAMQRAVNKRQPVRPATRESITEWVREYQTAKPNNPRTQFAALFKLAA